MTEEIELAVYGPQRATAHESVVAALYGEAYAEAPYHEGPDDVADFVNGTWARRFDHPGFRLVVASDDQPVGFALGYRLTSKSRWWSNALVPLSEDMTREWDGRTFVIIEIVVRRAYRQRGIAGQMHEHLLAGSPSERVTLTVPAGRARRSSRVRGMGLPLRWTVTTVSGCADLRPDGPAVTVADRVGRQLSRRIPGVRRSSGSAGARPRIRRFRW